MASKGEKGKKVDVILSVASGVGTDARIFAINLLRHEGTTPKKKNFGKSWASLSTMQQETGMCRARVLAAITELENANGPVRVHVTRGCREDGPGRAPNVYRLTVDLSPTDELSSNGEQSSTDELKSPEVSSDLSSGTGRPEFVEGGDLSSDVGTGIYSSVNGNLQNEPTQRENARERAVSLVFDHWSKTLASQKYPQPPTLTAGRRKDITKALQHSTPAELCKAIDGVRKSAWHMGENDAHEPYIELASIFEDRAKVEDHAARVDRKPKLSPEHIAAQRTARVQEELMRQHGMMSSSPCRGGRQPAAPPEPRVWTEVSPHRWECDGSIVHSPRPKQEHPDDVFHAYQAVGT
ncbi:MAG TPA: hypothetical protein VK540_15885 [Polyangiaceae bacterium]|nr:hypothetical protein [Polyangiaceae bacterium]